MDVSDLRDRTTGHAVTADAELHIAGVVVHALPSRLAAVRARIAALPGAEVHGAHPGGKLAVTLEDEGVAGIGARLHAVQQVPGVLSAVVVFQHADALAAMNSEIEGEA